MKIHRQGAEPMQSLSFLIADDDLRMRQLVRDILLEEGVKSELCSDGLEAARILTSRKIDILITDLMMPHLDGLEVLEIAKHANPDCRIVLLTGHATVESAVDALKKGAFDYVQKPFEPDDLLFIVRRAAEQSLRLQERHRLPGLAEGGRKEGDLV
jgi:DNA-binding NtrC family response regulator